ncbi:MAG TPA: hypothetical protein VGX91_12925 [Candidatus Cybelea sp.]|jgi:hypothetical protein|nr:hypothetical protein [Candidatus Cybelea sp.]
MSVEDPTVNPSADRQGPDGFDDEHPDSPPGEGNPLPDVDEGTNDESVGGE